MQPTRRPPIRRRSPRAGSAARAPAGGSGSRGRCAPRRPQSAPHCRSSDWRLSIPCAPRSPRLRARTRAHHDTPMVNVGHLLRHSAMCFPARPAITWRGATIDYRSFDARSAVFAEWLASVGAAPAERVVLYLDNCPDLLVAMFGTYRAGSSVLPTNSRLTEQELAFLVADGEAKVIVTDVGHVDTARRAAGDARVVVTGDELRALLDRRPTTLAVADVRADDSAWIFYTSGTTGRPKGAMLSHAVLGFVTVSWLADLTPLDEHDVTLHAAPLSHGAGFHELAVRGPSVMTGYWKRPDATAEAIVGGWLHTGDLGRMSADGVVHLLDRAKDMIISGGSNVYAVEVEDVLATHDSVADVAVVGIPDDLWGELVVAAVVPAAGRELEPEALDAHARSQPAGYKIPRRYVP